jgi:hypothetical protein
MTADAISNLLVQEKGAVLIFVVASAFVLLVPFIFRRLGRIRGNDPKVILSRCRWELKLVRDELSHYPATHKIQGIVEGLDSAEATIDSVMAKL